jgi:hypothetical protein
MVLFTQFSFNATGIRSLCWRGDQLVDWVGGGRAFAPDGTETPARVSYGYRFDAATASPDGRFAVIYERLGTKGLLLHDGRILREIDRSFSHAEAYEYPVALFNDPDGRLLLAHCPGNYGRIELEEAESGRPLIASADRKPSDFFHSRLAASPHGKRLLSAGWVWHPLSVVVCFDVAQASQTRITLMTSITCPYRSTRVWPRKVRPVGSTMTALQWLPRPNSNRIAWRVTSDHVYDRAGWRSTI